MSALQVGTLASPGILSSPHQQRLDFVTQIIDQGIDHVFVADHVSFHVGTGMDGLINAAMLAAMHPDLRICVGVYLLALRHPVLVARQLATMAEAAPKQLILGVGVGGEDRNEVAMCDVDPATRGKRTNECLEIIKLLSDGKAHDFDGEFFTFERAWIKPAPKTPAPIVVGGRAPAALERAGRFGDGWLGIWSTVERYGKSVAVVNAAAADAGREPLKLHGLQAWVGIDDNRDRARARLAKAMEAFYRVPFEKFERFCPYGTAEEVADKLAGYTEHGCRLFNLMPVASDDAAGIEAVAKIKARLAAAG